MGPHYGEWRTGKITSRLKWLSENQLTNVSTRRGLKVGGGLHPLLASSLASPLQSDVRQPDQTRASSKPTTSEKETTPPAPQTLQIDTATITVQRPPKTAQITPSPIIQRPATPPPSPESPPTKKQRTKSPTTNTAPTQYFHVDIEKEYPLHEKYDLQDVTSTKFKAIAKAQRLPRDDEEINVDLPVYFVYHRDNQHWTLIKGPTSKFYDEVWYE